MSRLMVAPGVWIVEEPRPALVLRHRFSGSHVTEAPTQPRRVADISDRRRAQMDAARARFNAKARAS